MLQEHLSRAEVDHRLRTHGVFNVGEVDLAILEPDVQLSARREEAEQPLASGLPAQTQQPLQNNDADPAG